MTPYREAGDAKTMVSHLYIIRNGEIPPHIRSGWLGRWKFALMGRSLDTIEGSCENGETKTSYSGSKAPNQRSWMQGSSLQTTKTVDSAPYKFIVHGYS